MIKFYKASFTVTLIFLFSVTVNAQNNFFTFAGESTEKATTAKREIFPQQFGAYHLNVVALRSF